MQNFIPYNIRVMTHASSQKLMPAPVATPGPRMVEGTPFASFQAHMLSFRDRVATMLDQSSAGSGLDISDIHTPVSQPYRGTWSLCFSDLFLLDCSYFESTVKASLVCGDSSVHFEGKHLCQAVWYGRKEN